MHVRLSTCIGIPVVDESTEEMCGILSGMLTDPDSGKIEGFFVRIPGFLFQEELFCSALDIVHWGTRVTVRDSEVLAPAEERIRLQPLLEDKRTIIGQQMKTESGKKLGKCRDIQFNTDSMHIEWLFPKKRWHWGIALPISEVLEVRTEAIIIRDSKKVEPVPAEPEVVAPALPALPVQDPGFSQRKSR